MWSTSANASVMYTHGLRCCSGLEDVLGVQLPKDLTTDEARDTLAKLVCFSFS